MSTLYLDVDGKPVPLRDVSWYLRTPCGCCCGVTMADTGYSRITTPSEALADFYPLAAQRRQKTKAGYRVEAGLRSEVRARLTAPGGCPHTPEWGAAKPPCPDGMAWAVSGWRPASQARLHLVPAERTLEKHVDSSVRDVVGADSLCGKYARAWWIGPAATYSRVECQRCCDRANALEVAS